MKKLQFTFGIITSHHTCVFMPQVLNSIYSMDGIDRENFEVIVVGGPNSYSTGLNFIHIPFDETPRNSIKKNLISEKASMENIVFLHDYFSFNDQWYNGFLEFGNYWDVCMTMILNHDGCRFRDWVMWDAPENQTHSNKFCYLAPYSYDKTQYMYISGAYWISKKTTMINEPLNKWLNWGECEDLEWSKRIIRKGYKYKMNPLSVVHILKPGKYNFKYLPE